MNTYPTSTRLYKGEFRWYHAVLQQRCEIIQHIATEDHPVGLREDWKDVKVNGEAVVIPASKAFENLAAVTPPSFFIGKPFSPTES